MADPALLSIAPPSSGEALADAPTSGVRLVALRSEPPPSRTLPSRTLAAKPTGAVGLCYGGGVSGDPKRTAELEQLAQAASNGDAAATRAVLEAVAPAMLAAIGAVLGHGDRDREDVLQDALVGVVQGLGSFRGESSFLHFARSIALRRALDQRRKRARRTPEVVLDEEPLDEGSASPAGDAVIARRRVAFRALLAELRPEQAEAFAERVLFGSSIEEIALSTGARVDTVKSRLRLAKAALRARIANDPILLELSETVDDDAP